MVFPYTDMNQPWIYMYSPSRSSLLPPFPSHPSGSSQCTSPEHLSHASNLGWWSVSPLTAYLFQSCSLWTSHSHLLPQSPKVCSVHLCLFFCFTYWIIWPTHYLQFPEWNIVWAMASKMGAHSKSLAFLFQVILHLGRNCSILTNWNSYEHGNNITRIIKCNWNENASVQAGLQLL